MNTGILFGGQAVCFCMLVILIISLFMEKEREKDLDLLLCAAILLLCAVMMSFVHEIHTLNGDERMRRVIGGIALALSAAAAAAMAAYFILRKPTKRNGSRLAALLAAFSPVWMAVPLWYFTRKGALFPMAETLSLLISQLYYHSYVQTMLKQRAEEIENHQAILFQWQMQPHFLFNTMSTIRELMNTNPALASAGIDNLAGYLRKNLDALTVSQMIPFERELVHIEQYVMLEKMNPANLFEVVYDLQIIDFPLPALTVQPLVENAIRHGVRSLGSDGMVFLTTRRHGDMVRITVEDNGPGFSSSKNITEQQRARASRGLENVRRRVETQCGGSLHLLSGENGTRVTILIPRRE